MNLQQKETPGQRIKRRRNELNLTMTQVSDAIGVSRMSISLWENDKTSISAANLNALAKVLGRDVNWIMNGNEVIDSINEIKKLIVGDSPTTKPKHLSSEHVEIENIINILKKLPAEEQKRINEIILERFDYYEKLYSELQKKMGK